MEASGPDPSVDEFVDDLNERIGVKACPICGATDWELAGAPHALPAATLPFPGSLHTACLICRNCQFVRLHALP